MPVYVVETTVTVRFVRRINAESQEDAERAAEPFDWYNQLKEGAEEGANVVHKVVGW